MSEIKKPYKVLVAGGCYAGLAAAIVILERCDHATPPIRVAITIVDERDGYYHVIGSPLALADKTYADKAWVEFRDVTILHRPDVDILHGSVTKVDSASKTAVVLCNQAERVIEYDFFIGATGLRRIWPVVPQSTSREAYRVEVGRHIDAVTNSALPILVVGGGAVGIEMAAELKLCYPKKQIALAHSRDMLLSAEPLPEKFKNRARKLLMDSGVQVLVGHRLEKSESVADGYRVQFSNGKSMLAGVVIMAVSQGVPSTEFLPSETLSEEGYVKVLPTLQFSTAAANSESHFAVGDVIQWSGIKRCGSAMHMGKLAGFNISQIMLHDSGLAGKKPKLKSMGEIPPMITLAVGKVAVSHGPRGTTSGKRTMQLFFEEDLGFRIVWDYLRLGGEPGSSLTWKQAAVNILMYILPEFRSIWMRTSQSSQKEKGDTAVHHTSA